MTRSKHQKDKHQTHDEHLRRALLKKVKIIYQSRKQIRYKVITVNPKTNQASSQLLDKKPNKLRLHRQPRSILVLLWRRPYAFVSRLIVLLVSFYTWFDHYEVEFRWPKLKIPKRKKGKKKRPKRKPKTAKDKSISRLRRRQIWSYLGFVGLMLGLLLAVVWLYHFAFLNLPSADELVKKTPPVSSKILDRNGHVLYKLYDDQNRTLVKLDQISPAMIYATIAIEDQNFYHHFGFDPEAIFRALMANRKGNAIQGGSTITQQLVKNRLLSPEKTIQRKIKELILAVTVEQKFSKDQILEMYLNQVAYGGSTYGVEEAAQRYFGKHASQLNLAEAALLAGLPQAPSIYSPFGPNPELAFKRQKEVLKRMVEEGYISLDQARKAANQPLTFKNDVTDIKAPHFVFYVKDILAKQYGDEFINRAGLEVKTTLDLKLQNLTQELVRNEIKQLKKLNIHNGAALVVNPQTGEILAMVGSKDYFDLKNDGQVNVVLRPRQPGSSIKPLTYALAFSQGYLPSDKILDAPITYNIKGSKPYTPKNYDGKFHGLVTLREALASSYNIPATKLLNQLGVDNLIDFAQKMGITTWNDRQRFGLSLTLGGGEVKMIDLAQAYSVFANQGLKVPLNPIIEIKDSQGNVIYQNPCLKRQADCPYNQVIDPAVAYEVTHVLKDNQARTPAFGPMSVLFIPNQEVAVKTGTTNNMRDNWTVGYTSNRLVAVWVGNNDNSPMSYVASGITGASPIWNKIMRALLDPDHPHRFPVPDTVTLVPICRAYKNPDCPSCVKVKVVEEVFPKGKEPTNNCLFAKRN